MVNPPEHRSILMKQMKGLFPEYLRSGTSEYILHTSTQDSSRFWKILWQCLCTEYFLSWATKCTCYGCHSQASAGQFPMPVKALNKQQLKKKKNHRGKTLKWYQSIKEIAHSSWLGISKLRKECISSDIFAFCIFVPF